MSLFQRPCFQKTFSRTSKWARYIAVVAFFLATKNAMAEPLTIPNPFVPSEMVCKAQAIQLEGQPVLILNPYVAPLASLETCPYRRIVPSPQVIFPASTPSAH